MAASVKPVPEGFHTATPLWSFETPRRPSSFTRKYSAPRNECECRVRMEKSSMPKLKIGDSIIFLSDEIPQHGRQVPAIRWAGIAGACICTFPTLTRCFQRAIAAGGKAQRRVTDMFWGDRHWVISLIRSAIPGA